jgi:hypothetical protein
LPGGLNLFSEEAPLTKDLISGFLLGKEHSNAANSDQAGTKDYVDDNKDPFEEETFLVKVALLRVSTWVSAQVVATANLSSAIPSPNI